MIESLPDVSHFRYRGERVEWRRLSDTHVALLPVTEADGYSFFADVYANVALDDGAFVGRVFAEHTSADEVDRVTAYTEKAAAIAVVGRCVSRGLLAPPEHVDNFVTFSPELRALASAVAQRQGQSLDDLLTRIVTTKVVSIAVVDYRDDPEIRRLHIALAESWGKE